MLGRRRVRRRPGRDGSRSPGSIPDFETYWRTQSSLNGALTQLLPTLPDAERDRLAAAVREAVEPFRTDDGYRAPGSALGVVATGDI